MSDKPVIDFTVQELMVIDQALLGAKANMEVNSHKIIKANGTDVYDSLLASVVTSIQKIRALVELAKPEQGENHADE